MASLAACSPAAEEVAASDCTPAASGSVSDAVEVTGAFGEVPEVTIESPLTVTDSERTVLSEGDGDVAEAGDVVTVDYSLYNGDSGEQIDTTSFDGSDVQSVTLGSLLPVLNDALQCSTVGSRVVGVALPTGMAEEGLTQFGLTAETALVIVADVISAEAAPEEIVVEQEFPKAEGEAQPLPDGFPAITVAIADDEAGTPTVTLPGGEAPADLQIATLIKGTGAAVAEGSEVLANYQGMIWSSSEIFDSSWERGAATQFDTSALIEGFTQALMGQTVGSQVLVTIPSELGYGETGQGTIQPGDDLVFLIDILGVTNPE